MLAETQTSCRFIRRTQLGPNEYRKNFHQIDREVMTVITSPEADKVTPLMSKIYLRLVNAPDRYWERDGVLRIEAEIREGKLVKAWAVCCEVLGVASATASKAIRWMHEQGIIGYFSGKNGVGLRIFLNRAVSSIGIRQAQRNKKILAFPPASFEAGHASAHEPAFNDSFAVKEVPDTDVNSRAPKTGADKARLDKIPFNHAPASNCAHSPTHNLNTAQSEIPNSIPLKDTLSQLRAELEPVMHKAAQQAAAREHERTREWLENRGLPKAARVAQHEAYNVLRKYGFINESAGKLRMQVNRANIGRSDHMGPEPHKLSQDEITELAQVCLTMLEAKGQPIKLTLSEMSTMEGGLLLPEDALKVREKVDSLLSQPGMRLQETNKRCLAE